MGRSKECWLSTFKHQVLLYPISRGLYYRGLNCQGSSSLSCSFLKILAFNIGFYLLFVDGLYLAINALLPIVAVVEPYINGGLMDYLCLYWINLLLLLSL